MPTLTQSIEINKNAQDVESVYINWSKYPEFVPSIKEVKDNGNDEIHCKIKLAGMDFSYTAAVKKVAENRYHWQTTEGSIKHSGDATIEPISKDRSRLTLKVDYEVPGPKIAGKVTNWLGLADSGLRSALENFRAYTENN